jgi:hypothetical protein
MWGIFQFKEGNDGVILTPSVQILISLMALTTEELEQIRAVVRSEIAQARGGWGRNSLATIRVLFAIFLAVLALHVVVIGGFTLYHLMSRHGA